MQDKLIEKIEGLKKSLLVAKKKIISSYQGRYLGIDTYDVTLNDGTKKTVETITKGSGSGDAVVIIPVTKEGKYLLIIESRPNTKEGVVIEFPAGMVDKGESPIKAAIRELREETGYTYDTISELEWHYQDQGCSNAIIRTYLATGCYKIGNQQLDEGERIKVIEVYEKDLNSLLYQENGIKDANTKIAALSLLLRKKD